MADIRVALVGGGMHAPAHIRGAAGAPGVRRIDQLKRLAVRGCDLLDFADGKITRKDSYWKIVEG